eukprot:3933418-Rhodomonas_salina.1
MSTEAARFRVPLAVFVSPDVPSGRGGVPAAAVKLRARGRGQGGESNRRTHLRVLISEWY